MADYVHYPTENISREWPERKIVGWSDPPAQQTTKTPKSTYAPIADELRARVGEWAQLDDRSSEAAAYQFVLGVRKGAIAAFRPGGAFEAAHSGPSVWVRYVGGDEEVSTPESAPVELERPARKAEPAPDPHRVFAV